MGLSSKSWVYEGGVSEGEGCQEKDLIYCPSHAGPGLAAFASFKHWFQVPKEEVRTCTVEARAAAVSTEVLQMRKLTLVIRGGYDCLYQINTILEYVTHESLLYVCVCMCMQAEGACLDFAPLPISTNAQLIFRS